MKHFRLLFTLLTLLIGGVSVSAQSWTASEVGEGYFMLYNVGTGQYLTRGNGWGTQATITTGNAVGNGIALRLAGSGSDFKMFTGINGDAKGIEHLNGGTIYLDQANGKNSTWTFTQVSTDNGPVYTIISKDNHGGGAGVYLTAGTDGTKVTPGTDGTIDGAKWKLMAIPAQPVGMDDASETNPVDATSLIVNPNFSFDAIKKGDGWTMQSSNYNPCGGNVSGENVIYNPCAESWRASFTLSQALTVPNGIYELTAQAAVTEYTVTGADMPVVYANDVTTPFKAMTEGESSMAAVATNFTAGKYTVNSIRVVVTNGSLTIGVRGTRTDTWCCWDNFKLTYKGVDLTALKEALQAQIDAVAALEGTTTTAAYNAAKNYADGINVDALTTEEEISTASAELSALVDAAKALQPSYSRYAAIRDAALAISANVVLPDVESATTAAEIDAAIPTLRANFLTELPNVTIPTDPGYIDVTAVMVDNASVRQNTDYWTIEGTANGNNSFGKCAYNECEFYGANFKFYQTLALTPGTWEFGVTGFHRAGNHTTYFYAGEDKILIPGVESSVVNSMAAAETYFDNGNGKVALKFLIEEAGNVEIGINNQDTQTDKWTIFRDFTLKYYGAPDYSVYVARLAELATEAAAVEGTVPTAVYTVLNSVVTENNTTHANKAEYLAAIAAIENAIADAVAKQGAYASYKSLNTLVQALYDVANYEELTEGAHETLGTALADATTDVETKTTIEDINAVAETLRAAGATYAGAANPTGEDKFNLTFMLTNPDVSSFPAWTAREDVPGWYTDQTDGNSQTMVNDAATSEDGTKTNFFEYWSNPAKANDLFALYQKVTLPLGTFDIKCYAFAQDQYAGQNSVGVYFYANDTQGSAVTTARLTEASLSFINDAEQEVKIGLKTIAGNTYNWMGIGYMELYKVPANTTEYAIITDGVENATVVATVDGDQVTEALALKNVTLTVTANEGYLVDDVTVTYADGEETKNVDLAKTDAGYTFQMPAFDVTVNVTTLELASEQDIEAFAEALQVTTELGFDEGDYAPYNNVENLTAAEAEVAKVNTELETYGGKATKATVVAATEAVNALNWIVNTEEVNAVYDGTFANAENDGAPAGWTMSNNTLGGDLHSRAFVGDERLAEFNETKSGFFIRFDGYNSNRGSMYFYGRTTGYTMPLKANTTYYVKADFAGWGSTGKPLRMNVTGPEGFDAVGQTKNTAVRADNADNAPQKFFIVFTTADAGNYEINFQTPGPDTNTHNVIVSNFELFKAQPVEITIKEGFTATTYSNEDYALDFSGTEGLTASIITDAEGTEVEVSSVPAGTGVYVEGEPGTYTVNILGTSDTDVSENKLVGTGNTAAQLTSDETTTYYVFGRQGTPKKEAFYKVKTDKATNVSANKAYLKIDVPASGAKDVIVVGGGETDGINSVEATETLNGDIYNLQGQKVNRAERGVYIVNGKKIVVK